MSTTSTRPATTPPDRTMSATRIRLRMAAQMMAAQARADAAKDGIAPAAAETHSRRVAEAYLLGASDQARDTLKDAARRNAAAQNALEEGIRAARPMMVAFSEAELAALHSGGPNDFVLADGPQDDLPQPGWFARLSARLGRAA